MRRSDSAGRATGSRSSCSTLSRQRADAVAAVPPPVPPAPVNDGSFEVVLKSSGKSFHVPPDKTILDVLIDAGVDPIHDCKRGECGVCQVGVVEGIPDHKDHILSDERARIEQGHADLHFAVKVAATGSGSLSGDWTMSRYRNNPDAVRALVRERRCIATSISTRRCSSSRWSTCSPTPGTTSATTARWRTPATTSRPRSAPSRSSWSRHSDGTVHVLYNRCPHKGTKIAIDGCGNAGKFFRCPYHAWTFKTDGSLLAIPLKKGYDKTGFEASEAAKGMTPVKHVQQLSRLRVRQAQRCRPGFRDVLRRQPVDASTTWSTARRLGGSRWRAACCATCTTAIGKCWSRTRPTPATRWSRTKARPAPPSTCGRRSAGARRQEAHGGRDLRAVHEPLRILRGHGHPRLGQRPRPHRRVELDPFQLFGRARAISSRWSRPTARRAPRRFSTRTGTTPSISRT